MLKDGLMIKFVYTLTVSCLAVIVIAVVRLMFSVMCSCILFKC